MILSWIGAVIHYQMVGYFHRIRIPLVCLNVSAGHRVIPLCLLSGLLTGTARKVSRLQRSEVLRSVRLRAVGWALFVVPALNFGSCWLSSGSWFGRGKNCDLVPE